MDYPPMPYPEWQRPLFDAVTEFNMKELMDKIRRAEVAITRRLKEPRSLSDDEFVALHDGLRTLRTLMTHASKEQQDEKRRAAG